MNEKEKYRAQIEARLMKFGESLYEITNKREQRKENRPDIQIDPILRKQKAVEDKLKQLDTADENSWQKYKAEVDHLVDGIDDDLRKAMAYFA
ncbi:MAG: hypothetical protein P8185_06995 [Deltaproteobacteria bacterium]|jgi:hypothetical protein